MKKKLTYRQKILGAFNFTYAGCAHVFIAPSRNKYLVCTVGFTYDGYNFFFSKSRKDRREFNSLYAAINAFNYVVNELTKTTDWYYNDFFKNEFEELYLEDVY